MTETQKALPAPKEKTCFVVMPIADMTGYDAGHFTRVYEDLIIPACDKAGFKADRADDVKNTTLIHSTILNRLIRADMVVCDLSGKNPNVMFELGIRQAFDKPVTLIKDETTNGIFDVDPLKYTTYSKNLKYNNVVKSQIEISESISETFSAKDDPNTINSIIRLLSIEKPAELKPNGDKIHDILLMMMSKISAIENKSNYKNEILENNIFNAKNKLTKKDQSIIMHILNESKKIYKSDIDEENKSDLLEIFYEKTRHYLEDYYDIPMHILDALNTIRTNFLDTIT